MKTILDNGTHKIEIHDSGTVGSGVIRHITTGSMQRRFTVKEEVEIDTGSDATCRTIKSRLMNADYCNLDFQDTIDGVSYIVTVLATVDDPEDESETPTKIVTDISGRIAALLANGTEEEKA